MPSKSFNEELAEWSHLNLLNCIGVDECMKICPVAPADITIGDLNEATRNSAKLEGPVLKFTQDCIQCGQCDQVCPTSAARSIMMLKLKEKMAQNGQSPANHKSYFALKGHDKSALKRTGFNVYMKNKWKLSGDRLKNKKLASHISKKSFRQAEYLFYFGCYIFTGEQSAAQCVDIADRLSMDYEVLGGLDSCCGWPQLLAGRTDEAEDYHKRLADLVGKSDPSYVITGCAECYMSLRKIKEKYGMRFEPLTTPEWFEKFADELGLEKSDETVTFHDSCHISRKTNNPEPATQLLSRLNPVVEMERSGTNTYCCGYWGLNSDPAQLSAIHESRYKEAKKTGANTMVVECVTCLESFSKDMEAGGVVARDIVDLVHERMNIK